MVVVVVDGKETSGFPDKSIQRLFALVRVARRARPRTLVRYAIGRVFWMVQMIRNDRPKLELAVFQRMYHSVHF
jgi:hypothetical protein